MSDLSTLSDGALLQIAKGGDPRTVTLSDAEQRHGLPAGLLSAVINRGEASGIDATSPKGAHGIAQLMPATARQLGVDSSDPVSSIDGAGRYLAQNLKRFGGRQDLAVAAYNAGPGAVEKYGGVPPYAETQAYVPRVLNAAGASAAPAQTDAPDMSGMSDEQLQAIAGQQGQPSAATPAPPAGPVDPGVYNKDAPQQAADPAQAATARDLQRRGLIDLNAEPGSAKLPFLQTDNDLPSPGKFYFEKGTGALKQVPGGDGPAPRQDFGLGFEAGLMHPLDRAAEALEGGLAHLGVPTDAIDKALGMNSAAQATQQHQQELNAQRAQGVVPSGLGKIAGGTLATFPLAEILPGAAVGGAAYGALDGDSKSVGGVLRDAALGAIGGKVGVTALNGVTQAIAPTLRKGVQTLIDAGVPLTPGQVMGGVTKRVEDAASSIPFLGDTIKAAQRRSFEGLNRAAANRALLPIGEQVPKDVEAGHDMVAYAGDQLSKAYDDVLSRVKPTADAEFGQNLVSLAQNAKSIGGGNGDIIHDFIANEVAPRLSPNGGMTGEGFKDLQTLIGQKARQFGKSPDPNQQDVGSAFREMGAQLNEMLKRSAGGEDAQRLSNINQGYANLVRVENAAVNTKDGVFTPGQLRQAVTNATGGVRRRSAARGEALMQDLATAGQSVLPSSVPDSGTPLRAMIGLGAAGLGGAALHVSPLAIGGGMLAAAPYTKLGQLLTSAVLTKRPQQAQTVADILARLKAPAVGAGSAAAIQASQ